MPIEIRELVIRAQIDPQGVPGPAPIPAPGGQGDGSVPITTEDLTRILADLKER